VKSEKILYHHNFVLITFQLSTFVLNVFFVVKYNLRNDKLLRRKMKK